jgi:hypothetical protein
MRLQVRRKVERFERRAARSVIVEAGGTYIEEVQQMNQKIFNAGKNNQFTAPIAIADHIENSLNQLAGSNANSDVKAAIEQLLKEVAEVAKKVPGDKSKEIAENAERLTTEISRAKPQRKWYELSIEGLKEAGGAIGEVGKPIIETAGKLLPLLAALWP